MRGRYVFALAILGAYFIASYLILHGAIIAQRSIARTVTVSGQQRMYSQRIAMFAGEMVERPNESMQRRARRDLERSIAIFARQHHELTSGDESISPSGWPPASVRRMYFDRPFEVDRHVRDYLAHAQNVLAKSGAGAFDARDHLVHDLSAART